jgi:hypothetical protein
MPVADTVIQDWIPIILAIGSMLVAVAVTITKKDSGLHEKISTANAISEERFKTLFVGIKELDTKLGNHIAHGDEKLEGKIDRIVTTVTAIDKQLFAHMQNSDKN